jgi:glutaredoxin-like protein NrdH
VKEFLSRAGRAFTVRNVDEDPDAFNEMVALGLMSIPVTIVGDYVVRGYDEKKLREALAATA